MRGLLPVHIAVATLLAASSGVVMAQETTSSVRGSVSSDAGVAVAGATVTIVHTPSGTTSTSMTNASGSFSAPGLRPGGPYTISVAATGFGPATLKDVYLGVGEPLNLPVVLGASGVMEEVVVSGQAATQLAAGPTTVLDREAVEGVASVNRDIRDVARHDPFASFNPTTRGVQIAGTNNRTNKFSVDGLNFSDSFGLNQGGMPTTRGPVPMDAVEQLSVKVAPYDITEGDFQGGSINVVLRSGGNKPTGSVFYSYTSDSLTGDKSRGSKVNLDFTSKDWGAFLSGAIIENTLFFALAYENLRQGNPADVGLVGAPSPITSITQAQVDQVSAIAQSLYGYDTRGLRKTLPEKDDKYTVKADWNINESHRLSYTGIFQETYQQSPLSGFSTPTTSPSLFYQAYATNEPESVNSSALQLNSQWTDAFSTEARLNFRNYSKIPSSLGLPGFPEVQVCLDPVDTGSFSQCSQNGTGRLFFGLERFSQADVVKAEQKGAELVARLSLGEHSLKAQAVFSKTDITNVFVQSARGVYYFDSIAALQTRNASQLVNWQYSITGDLADTAASFGFKQYTLGLQDSWNIMPGLNLTYGLRSDFYQMGDRPPANQFFQTRYGFSNNLTIDGNSVLQPRVSLTWRPGMIDGLTVRAGFGLFNGGSPVVFLGNSFSVAGVYSNSLSATRTATGCTGVPAALCADALNNVGTTPLNQRTALFNYLSTNTGALSAAPVNGMTSDFKLPSTWKANLSIDYAADLGVLGEGWNLGTDIYRTYVQDAAQYTDLRLRQVGSAPDGRPIYADTFTNNSSNSDLLMSNTSRGQSTIVVVRADKRWDFGLGAGFSYANQNVKSLSDMASSGYSTGGTTGTGTYGGSPMIDPNASAYGTSIYQIKDNYKLNLDFKKSFFAGYATRVALFGELRSGTPYNLGMSTTTAGGRSTLFGTIQSNTTTDRRYMLYVPNVSSQTADPLVSYASTVVYESLRDYVVAMGLKQGAVVSKNSERSPDFFKLDLHLEQEIPFFGESRIKVFADVENLLNLLNDKWGSFRYYDPLQAVVAASCAQASGTSCTQYRYSNFTKPSLRTDGRLGLWNLRLGFRVEF
jgi:Carboxypeptidase regulatory-like domain